MSFRNKFKPEDKIGTEIEQVQNNLANCTVILNLGHLKKTELK
jgi:hypothetical protein